MSAPLSGSTVTDEPPRHVHSLRRTAVRGTHGLTRIEVRPAPCSEPPYSPLDYGHEPGHRSLRLVEPMQVGLLDQLTYADQLPFDAEAPASTETRVDPLFAPQPTSRDHLPCPRQFATRLTQAVVEVMAGRRPVQQLMPVTSQRTYAGLLTRLASSAGAHMPSPRRSDHIPGQVRTIRIDEPADGVAEACAVVSHGERFRAIALRLEGIDGRWRCTVLQLL